MVWVGVCVRRLSSRVSNVAFKVGHNITLPVHVDLPSLLSPSGGEREREKERERGKGSR